MLTDNGQRLGAQVEWHRHRPGDALHDDARRGGGDRGRRQLEAPGLQHPEHIAVDCTNRSSRRVTSPIAAAQDAASTLTSSS